ncbi:hypothetical protein [Saccharothrix hoggarensis]|uniref:Uncharacterized protein n=1 Tax=Saccharothrix hoggarensis TaxID=913853 RepID=A0ABW3QSU9_9PSEU
MAMVLGAEEIDSALLIEMLLPVLWLSRLEAFAVNSSVEGAMVLHHAYEQFGITSYVYTVTFSITDSSTDWSTKYGRLDPRWDAGVLDGHCLLWLPQSGRVVDATVEQFSTAPGSMPQLLVGRGTSLTPPERTSAGGGLAAGTLLPVLSPVGLLHYELTGPEYRDLVSSSLTQEANEQYRRAGVNLASRALTLLRVGPVAERVRKVPYPRLHALLDAVGNAEFVVEPNGDFFFTIRSDDVERSLRLDAITIEVVDALVSRYPEDREPRPGPEHDLVKETLSDVATEARVLRSGTTATGGGDVPIVLFEPRGAVGVQVRGFATLEAQAEGIIMAGFSRFLPNFTAVPRLSSWSVRHTPDGLELWDGGGIWARAELSVDDEWLAAAEAHQMVRVIYGVFVGVRVPHGRVSYTDADREVELVRARHSGIVAVAEIPWAGKHKAPGSRWWHWNRRTASRWTVRRTS